MHISKSVQKGGLCTAIMEPAPRLLRKTKTKTKLEPRDHGPRLRVDPRVWCHHLWRCLCTHIHYSNMFLSTIWKVSTQRDMLYRGTVLPFVTMQMDWMKGARHRRTACVTWTVSEDLRKKQFKGPAESEALTSCQVWEWGRGFKAETCRVDKLESWGVAWEPQERMAPCERRC